MRALLVALLVALAACTEVETDGPDAQGYTWRRDGPRVDPANWHYHVVSDGNVFLHCMFDVKAESCALVRTDGSRCDIYLPAKYAPWRKAHEERHCDGWRHPDPLRGTT